MPVDVLSPQDFKLVLFFTPGSREGREYFTLKTKNLNIMNQANTILFCLAALFIIGVGIGYLISYRDKHKDDREYQNWKNTTRKGASNV